MRTNWTACAVSAAGLLVFLLIAWQVSQEDGPVVRFDERVAAAAKDHAQDHPHLLQFARIITHAGDGPVLTAIAIVALLLLRQHPRLAVIWLLAVLLEGMIIQNSKELVGRQRPGEALRDQAVHERNPSYPSGHALGSMVGYGALAYAGLFVLRRRLTKVLLMTLVAITLLVIGWTRIYLRAHWCSDVQGGWALGLAWLGLCVAIVDCLWRQKKSESAVMPLADGTS
jgi:undecaprenyl-diphosphatase